jgi:AraC-like DNA-binding protein
MIVFDFRPPSPILREYVRLYQIIGFEFKQTDIIPSKPYWPRPENYLTFYPRDTEIVIDPSNRDAQTRKPRSTIIGQPSFVTRRQVGQNFLAFQVVFQPGALFQLTGIPANEMTNTFIDAESVFSKEIHLVNERLSSSGSHLDMIEIVEEFLCYLVRRAKYDVRPVDKVSLYLLSNPRHVSLDWLASEACLSRKQFYRKFVERMGVSPKMYSRIIQFDNAVKLKNARPTRDWLDIALELGYYDYQHLVRDFKEFTHMTPAQFYLQDSQAPERKFGYKEM